MTVSERGVLCVAPLVPTTGRAYVPAAVVALTDTVSALVAVPFKGGVTETGLKAHVAPAGRPVQDRLTAETKPFRLPTVAVLVPLAPWATFRLPGETETVKSGGGGAVLTAKTRSSWSS